MEDAKNYSELELDAQSKARGAALIGKIYTAQKEREDSIKKRLKQVTEEREELTKKLKNLEKDHNNGIDSGLETNSIDDDVWLKADSMSLDEIVGLVVNGKHSKHSIEFNGEVSVDPDGANNMSENKESLRRRKSSSSSTELRKLQTERDSALKQVDQLTNELHEAQRERSMLETQHRKSEKKRLKTLQCQMKGVVKERDEVAAKNEILQQELQRERMQSRRLADSDIFDIRYEKLSSTLQEYQLQMEMDEREKTQRKAAYDELYNRLTQVVDEKNELSLQVQETNIMLNEEKKRAEKLERLLIALKQRKGSMRM